MKTVRCAVAFAILLFSGAALAQPGPGPTPNPWVVSGASIFYSQGGVKVGPSSLANLGIGTINASVGFYINGVPVAPVTGGASGTILQGVTSSAPIWTATPSLGTAGSVVGKLSFQNLTSGSITVQPKTGALGSSILTIPAVTDTFAVLGTAQLWTAAQTFSLNSGTLPTAISNTVVRVSNADSTTTRIGAESYGAISAFTVARAGGTGAAPTQVLSGTEIGGFNAFAWGSNAAWNGPISSVRVYAAENITGTAWGSKVCLATTPATTVSLADSLCQQASGGLTVGAPTGGDKGIGTINAAGTIYINGTAVTAAAITALTGDGTATGPGSAALTLATVNTNTGSWGTTTQSPQITVNGKGLITAAANVTVTPAVGSITGLGTGVATALAVNVGTAGSVVVNGGVLGTPSSGVATNLTGTAAGLTAGTVTTNANLTGDVTSVGNATTIAANAVTNAKAAQMAAYTFKGNVTGSTANATDFTIAGLTNKASPAGSDLMIIADSAASNATKYSTITQIVGSVVAGVSSVGNASADTTLTIAGTGTGPWTGAVTAKLNLSNANIWAAVQTFTNSDIKLLGSSTGATTFTSANASATNYTLTFPAITSTLATTIASGAKALATGAIASAACTSAQTDTATGTLTTDAIIASFNGDPTAVTGYVPLVTGMLSIIAYPTADTVNFKVCNNTAASITPGAITINWRVAR